MKHNDLVSLLSALKDNDGATLKSGECVSYPNGYQVADYGKQTKSAEEAAKFVEEMNGDAGLWYSNGVFYVDHSIKIDISKPPLNTARNIISRAFSSGKI